MNWNGGPNAHTSFLGCKFSCDRETLYVIGKSQNRFDRSQAGHLHPNISVGQMRRDGVLTNIVLIVKMTVIFIFITGGEEHRFMEGGKCHY